jgi:hypothetical protein
VEEIRQRRGQEGEGIFCVEGEKAEKAPKHLVAGLQKKTKNSERDDARGADRAKKTWGTGRERRFKKLLPCRRLWIILDEKGRIMLSYVE